MTTIRFLPPLAEAVFSTRLVILFLTAAPAVASQPGSLDTSFNPGIGVGTNEAVFAVARQLDGKIIIAGDFTTVDGASRNRVARLSEAGALDSGFNLGSGPDDLVNTVALQGNNLLIGGYFTAVDGASQGYFARLNSNGGLDTSFNSGLGADSPVLALAIQSDAKVLLGGEFANIDNIPRANIGRLNSSGSLDTSFNPVPGVGGAILSSVRCIAVRTNGDVIIGGTFTSVNGAAHTNLARLNTNGIVDNSFNPVVGVAGAGVLAGVYTVAVQSDGKIVIGGDFTGVNGIARTNIARLNANGTLDTSFSPTNGPNAAVSSAVVQSNGKIVIGGFFTIVNGTARNYVARLNGNGSLDTSFDPGSGADDAVYAVALQNDGQVLIGGLFSSVNGSPRRGIARLHGNPITPSPFLFDSARTNNIFWVSVVTLTGQTYTLEFKNAFSDAGWTSLPGVVGDGSIKTLTDSSATNAHRFYRVRVN